MPHELLDDKQAAAYLHMDLRDLHKLASRGAIPCRKVGSGFRFRKGEIDHWVEERMHTLDPRRLADIERGVSRHHGFETHETLLVCPLVPHGGVAVPLAGRTRDGALRALVDLASQRADVYNPQDLLSEVRQREDLCSTAIAPGVALPHPRHPLPYDIGGSFVVVGLSPGGVPFGAADGSLTRLFFLICCKDDRSHLHVLARLAQMLHERGVVDELLSAQSPEALAAMLLAYEQAVLGRR